jgi:hypothetical protein
MSDDELKPSDVYCEPGGKPVEEKELPRDDETLSALNVLHDELESLRQWHELLEWMDRAELAEPGPLPKQVIVEEERAASREAPDSKS